MTAFKASNGAVTLAVQVVPRARKNQVAGVEGDAIKIRLSVPPVEKKANDALIGFLADVVGVARAQIEIVMGHRARRKFVRVRGITSRQIEELSR